MAEHCYVECQICLLPLMLSVTLTPFMLIVVMLIVIILIVVMLIVVMLSVVVPFKFVGNKKVRPSISKKFIHHEHLGQNKLVGFQKYGRDKRSSLFWVSLVTTKNIL